MPTNQPDIAKKAALEYEMRWIIEPKDLGDERLVNEFFDLYEDPSNFPDPDELEERGNIIARIRTGSDKPHTHLIALRSGGRVRAGCIAEFYPESSCVLLTYIFVDQSLRKQGVARKLLLDDPERSVARLIGHIEEKHRKKVRAVFFESNNPLLTDPENDSIPPAERMLAFYKLGGRRTNFDYVQPPLGEGKGAVENLYLCMFPSMTGAAFVVKTEVIVRFLVEFYASLWPFHPLQKTEPGAIDHDRALALDPQKWRAEATAPGFRIPEIERMVRQILSTEYLRGHIYLKSLPRIEQPKLYFERAAICLEFTIDEDHFEPEYVGGQLPRPFPLPSLEEIEDLKEEGREPALVAEKEEARRLNGEYCVVTHSFETDLFAYSPQVSPPYYTRCYNFCDIKEVDILFPQTFDFVSEGREETFFLLEKEKGADGATNSERIEGPGGEEVLVFPKRVGVFLNFTYFKKSHVRVWHLVFASLPDDLKTPDFDESLSELEIIKLTKFFGGAQESRSMKAKAEQMEQVRFRTPDGEVRDVYGLFERMANVNYRKKEGSSPELAALKTRRWDGREVPDLSSCLKSGIVQIDSGHCKYTDGKDVDQQEFLSMLEKLYDMQSEATVGEKATVREVEQLLSAERAARYVFEAYCGITLGILDYGRMGYEEVSDTLLPRSATSTSFLTLNRGVMTSFGHGDSVLESAWPTIGISPYLLVPSAVLAHNEYVSIDAHRKAELAHSEIEKFDQKSDRPNLAKRRISELEAKAREIHQLLEIELLPNVFQYPTEQDLYKYGMKHRGIIERNRQTVAYLDEIREFTQSEQNRRLGSYQLNLSIVGFLLAAFGLWSVIEKVIADHKWDVAAFNLGCVAAAGLALWFLARVIRKQVE